MSPRDSESSVPFPFSTWDQSQKSLKFDLRWFTYDLVNMNIRLEMVLNTLMLIQNGCHFADNVFKCIFLNENIQISIRISLKFDPKGPLNNIPALVQIMAWCRPGNKPLSETMMVKLPMHICFAQLNKLTLCGPWKASLFLTLTAATWEFLFGVCKKQSVICFYKWLYGC